MLEAGFDFLLEGFEGDPQIAAPGTVGGERGATALARERKEVRPVPLEGAAQQLPLNQCLPQLGQVHPGLGLPAGFEPDPDDPQAVPLPVGLQLMGRFGDDEALLDVGEFVEGLLAGQ